MATDNGRCPQPRKVKVFAPSRYQDVTLSLCNAIIECAFGRIVMCCHTPNGSALKCNAYAATTAIGVISTMISGMAKEAAVSNVLAGNSVP
jgi:hypothetical protein